MRWRHPWAWSSSQTALLSCLRCWSCHRGSPGWPSHHRCSWKAAAKLRSMINVWLVAATPSLSSSVNWSTWFLLSEQSGCGGIDYQRGCSECPFQARPWMWSPLLGRSCSLPLGASCHQPTRWLAPQFWSGCRHHTEVSVAPSRTACTVPAGITTEPISPCSQGKHMLYIHI